VIEVDVRQHILYKRDTERTLKPEIADHMLAALDAGATPDYQALFKEATWPPLPAVTYHTAPLLARDAILAEGLKQSLPLEGNWGGIDEGQIRGVYLGSMPDEFGIWSHWQEWDIWEVDSTDLPSQPDLMNGKCWVVTADIPPDRLTLWSPMCR
jgi:hypothetical protein